MTSIALAVFIVFIIYVMIWSLKNDDVRSIGEQTGLIRMRDPAKEKPARGKDAAPSPATPQAAPRPSGRSPARRPASPPPPGARKPKTD